MDMLHGPRRVSPATYDRWLAVLRATNPCLEFTDPPVGPPIREAMRWSRSASARHPLAAIAVLAGSDDLPRQHQQLLFDTAEGITL
jgi:hypothetical protein